MDEKREMTQLHKFLTAIKEPELFELIENLIADNKLTPRERINKIIEMGEKWNEIISRSQEKAPNGVLNKTGVIEFATKKGYVKQEFFKRGVKKFIIDGTKFLISHPCKDKCGGWNFEKQDSAGKTWDTAYTLLALYRIQNSSVSKPTEEIKESIQKRISSGKKWLKDNAWEQGDEAGWRETSKHEVNVYETSLVVCCLSELGDDDSKVEKAINFLKNAQNNDGGWGAHKQKASEIGATAFAVAGLLKSKKQNQFKEKLQTGFEWLLNNQNDDGGWGTQHGKESVVSKTCDAISVLVDSGDYLKKEQRNKAIEGGVDWLMKNQRTVGDENYEGHGWRKDDHFVNYLNTAMAVKTLLNTTDARCIRLLGSSSIHWLVNMEETILQTSLGGVIPRVIISLDEYLSRVNNTKSKELF
jgi:prenyltransferase beta subunit